MKKHDLRRRLIGTLAILIVTIIGTVIVAKARPPRRPPPPRRRVLPPLRPGRWPPARPLVVPRLRPIIIDRTAGSVTVQDGATVVRAGTVTTIGSAGELKGVPRKDFSTATAHRVERVESICTVVLTIDGQQTKVRLVGVAPAELKLPHGSAAHQRQAEQFLRNLLAGEFVYLDYDPGLAAQDADGQTVAYLYRAPDGLLINLEVIRQGYALCPAHYRFQHDDLFGFYERKAQADGKGLWASQH